MSAPAIRPRTSGGFNQGFGDFNDHLDEAAMENAVQQKSLGQQATLSSQPTTGGSALGVQHAPGSAMAPGGTGNLAHTLQPAPPREVGTIPEELIQRPAQDIVAGLKSFFNVNELLGINPATDDPETKARKQKIAQNFQKLEQEDQEVVKRKYQAEMQKKQQEQQEAEARKQREAQEQAQTLQMPSSPNRGAVGPGGQKKPAAVTKLEQDRKTLGGPQNVG